jgi:hypothetical protein
MEIGILSKKNGHFSIASHKKIKELFKFIVYQNS